MNSLLESLSRRLSPHSPILTFFRFILGEHQSNPRTRRLFLVVIGLFIYLPLLWWHSIPLTGDQKIYLNIALEMAERGDWLTPFLFEQTSFQKPPFLYWVVLLSWKIFGLNSFATHLPGVLFLIGLALCTDRISRSIFQDSPFSYGGLWIYPTVGALTFATSAQMEISQAFFYALSWVFGLKYLESPYHSRSIKWIYYAFAIAGLSALIKSPLYSVFWVLGYLLYLLISGEWDLFRSKHLYFAWILGILLGSSWFLWALIEHGYGFWDQYFSYETYLKSYTQHGTNWRMWLSAFYHGLPISLLIIPFAKGLKSWRRAGGLLQFFIGFGFIPAFFFTLYPYKVSTYLFLLFPVFALIADWALLREGKSFVFRTTLQFIGFSIAFCLLAAAILVPAYDLMESRSQHTLWIFIFLSLAALIIVSSLKNILRAFLWCLFGVFLIIRILLAELGEIDIQTLRVEAGKADQVYLLDDTRNVWNERALFSVALGKKVNRLENLEQVINTLKTQLNVSETLVILTDKQSPTLIPQIEAQLNQQIDVIPWRRLKNLKRTRNENLRDQMHKVYTLVRIKPTG